MSENKTEQPPAHFGLGYSRHDDLVTLGMTTGDFGRLMLCLWIAGGLNDEMRALAMDLANRLNTGRPRSEWVPLVAEGVYTGHRERASGGTEYP